MTPLDEWQEGDRAGAAKLNQPIAAIKELRQRIGGPIGPSGAGVGGRGVLGRIKTTGPKGTEANYTDSRYWVQFAHLSTEGNTTQPNTAVLDIRDLNRKNASEKPDLATPDIVTATNLAEVGTNNSSGRHALLTNSPAWLFQLHDSGPQPTKRWVFFTPPEYIQLVKITGSASGGGKYTGVTWDRPTVNIPATGNLTEAELGISGTTIRILNSREVALATHDLASAAFLPLLFIGFFRKIADDGVPVYVIDGQQWENCT